MSYKFSNKNLAVAALTSLIALGVSGSCNAQGIVSLVEDEDISLPKTDNNSAPSANLMMDTEVPDVLPDDDLIPLDKDSLISPAPATAPAAVEQPAPAVAAAPVAETPAPAPAAAPATETATVDDFDQDADFSLDLDADDFSAPEPAAQPAPIAATATALQAPAGNLLAPAAASQAPAGSPLTPAAAQAPKPQSEKFGNSILAKMDNDLFNQMSDIEKQTTLLTLELRREKLRNEIEAVKAQRQKALDERLMLDEEKKRKEQEWQKEQETKVLKEQQILKDKEIELEKIKQKKVLNAYMNKMLEENQKWIKENAELFKKMKQVEGDRKALAEDFKKKMDELSVISNKAIQSANNAKSNHDRTLASLTAQNVQLKKRIEADALAAKNRQQNPFAEGSSSNDQKKQPVATSVDNKFAPINIGKEYAIMEITGKGNDLVATLINKEGDTFQARRGTMLQTGHSIEDITPTYIQLDRDGLKDYLYTTGSAMSMEPEKMEGTAQAPQKPKSKPVIIPRSVKSGLVSEKSVPSLGTGMFIK